MPHDRSPSPGLLGSLALHCLLDYIEQQTPQIPGVLRKTLPFSSQSLNTVRLCSAFLSFQPSAQSRASGRPAWLAHHLGTCLEC